MSTTFRSLRQSFGLMTGFMRTFTTTSDGVVGGTTVVSTTLSDESNDYYNGWWVYALLGTPAYKRVSDFVASSGTLTTTAFASQVVSSTACELWRYNPAYVDEAIKRTLEAIYPRLWLPYLNENLVTGNWLRDGGFEEWSSSTALTFYSKSHATNLTLAQETSTKLWGTYAVKGTASAASQYLQQSESNNPWLLDLAGQSVTFRAWVWTATANSSRLQIVQTDKDGNSTTSSSSYHAGDSRWHLLECADIDIDEDVRSVAFRLTVTTDTAVAYFDHARVTGPPVSSLFLPRSGWKAIRSIEVQRVQGRQAGGEDLDPCDDLGASYEFIPYHARIDRDGTEYIARFVGGAPTYGRRVRLRGVALLTVPSSDTATTEIDSPQTEYLLAETAVRFYGMAPEGIPKEDVDRFAREQSKWLIIAERLRRQHEMLLPPSYMRA